MSSTTSTRTLPDRWRPMSATVTTGRSPAEGVVRIIVVGLAVLRRDGSRSGRGRRLRDGRRDGRRDGGALVVVAGQQDSGTGEELDGEGVPRRTEEGLVVVGPAGGDGLGVLRHRGLLGRKPGLRLVEKTLGSQWTERQVADRPTGGCGPPTSRGGGHPPRCAAGHRYGVRPSAASSRVWAG